MSFSSGTDGFFSGKHTDLPAEVCCLTHRKQGVNVQDADLRELVGYSLGSSANFLGDQVWSDRYPKSTGKGQPDRFVHRRTFLRGKEHELRSHLT